MNTGGSCRPRAVLLVGVGLSSLGDFAAVTVLALQLYETGQPPFVVSALMLAGLLPLVLFGPVAGAAVDRFDTTRLLRLVLAAQAVLAVALAFAESTWLILALVFALGIGITVTQSGILALLPRLAPAAQTTRLTGWFEASRSVGTTLGPPLGGALAELWGTPPALLVDAVTFAALSAAMWLIPTSHRPGARAPGRVIRDESRYAAVAGVRHIARDRQVRLAVLLLTVSTFFLAGVSVVEVYFARDVLQTGDFGYGALVGAWGVGMIAGALGAPRLVRVIGSIPGLVGAGLLAGVALAVSGAIPVLPVALTGWALAGISNGVFHVAIRTVLYERTPAHLYGRVFGAQYAVYSAAKVASLVTVGPAVALLQPRATIFTMGAATILTGAVGGVWVMVRYSREERQRV